MGELDEKDPALQTKDWANFSLRGRQDTVEGLRKKRCTVDFTIMDQSLGNKRNLSHALGGGTKRPKLMTPEKNRRLPLEDIIEGDTPLPSRISSVSHRLLSPPQQAMKLPTVDSKVSIFNDPIHGNIQMTGLCLRIIDTKEFQRLRELKQLGVCDFVYPGATHTRFSHSIGVAHFAERVIRTLMQNQPELHVTEADLLCVKVAGLCHDLGHGPFSHIFDGVFMQKARPHDHWRHEDWSVSIFEHLLEQNDIDLSLYGLFDIDRTFICEIIRGTKDKDRTGRPREKYFLYDIVNNSRSGLDVDKLDYFQRDIRHTNVDATYNDFQRFVEFGRVMRAEPIHPQSTNGRFSHLFASQSEPKNAVLDSTNSEYEYMICYPEKMLNEAVQLFSLRFQLHQKVYTHRTIKKVEFMLVDAMLEADPYIRIPGTRTEKHPDGLYRMSECIEDPAALSNINDSVVFLIETSTQPELKKAQDILHRLRRREFYDCLGKTFYKRGSNTDRSSEEEIIDALMRCASEIQDRVRKGLPIGPEDNIQFQEERAAESVSDDIAGMSSVQSLEYFSRHETIATDDMIFSQDSFAPSVLMRSVQMSQSLSRIPTENNNSQSSCTQHTHENLLGIELLRRDIIVEKMHIHYGLKSENPVNRLRFFHKGSMSGQEPMIGRAIKESQYETVLPRVFEELAIRVFCRDSRKTKLLMKSFEKWCRDQRFPSPMLALSQVQS